MDTEDPRMQKALFRYERISAYLSDEPPRGQRKQRLEQLAARPAPGPDGELVTVSAETLRAWIRRYRRGGLAGLMDAQRPSPGVLVLSPEVAAKAVALKREVPHRSLDRIITMMEALEMAEPGTVARSTLHRVLQANGASKRPAAASDRQDLNRFEAAAPNGLWQSGQLAGPWLPDPARPGKVRRAWMSAFLDDHSRLLLDGRFSFKGDSPALELVFRRAMQKYGVAQKVYYDNGQVYRSHHMRQIVAALGIHCIIHTQPYRPMGHGKIEAFNRVVRSQFLAELKASQIETIEGLNEAFAAWVDLEYNRSHHSEIGQSPRERWQAGIERVRYADQEALRLAFLWTEHRTADKTGVFSLFATRYQVSAELAKRRLEVRYNPEALHEVEVWRDGKFKERVRPLEIHPWRRPRPAIDETTAPTTPQAPPVADWLGHLTKRHRAESGHEVSARSLAGQVEQAHAEALNAVVDLLRDRVDAAVFDEADIRAFLVRFGPVDAAQAEAALDRVLAQHPADLHIDFYLNAIPEARE